MTDEPRDRNFGPAVRAAIERAANHSTDPRWDAKAGGLPESHSMIPDCRCEYCARLRGMRATLTQPLALQTSLTAGIDGSTITPPHADPLSPYQRSELERIAGEVETALGELRAFLRRA